MEKITKRKTLFVRDSSGIESLIADARSGVRHLAVCFEDNLLVDHFVTARSLEKFMMAVYPAIVHQLRCKNLFREEGNGQITSTQFAIVMARCGFQELADLDLWEKPYGALIPRNFDYLSPWVKTGKLASLDPQAVYSRVLGSDLDEVYSLLATRELSGKTHVIEAMAGSADLSWGGTYVRPDLHYTMIDLDRHCRDRVMAYPLDHFPSRCFRYHLGSVLSPSTWKKVGTTAREDAVVYIGKQSINYFDPNQLVTLLEQISAASRHLLLEFTQPYVPSDTQGTDDLTPIAAKRAPHGGLGIRLRDVQKGNDITGRVNFDLEVYKIKTGESRSLLSYDWWAYNPQQLYALCYQRGWKISFLRRGAFLPASQGGDNPPNPKDNIIILIDFG